MNGTSDGIISAINFKLNMQKVEDPEGGHRAVITLDGKRAKTPGRHVLAVRSAELAKMMAAEWAAQLENIDSTTMPLTRDCRCSKSLQPLPR